MRKRTATFRVPLRLDGAREVVVEVEPVADVLMFHVRGLRRLRKYSMPLSLVADMVSARVAKTDAELARRK